MLAEALGYASAGWPVFPLKGKHPLTKHGFHDATLNHDRIYDWWHRWPRANIGYAIHIGLMVIDVDPRAGGSASLAELTNRHGPLPDTYTVISGREDGGCHFYLLKPDGKLTSSRLPKGIDLREGGKHYVVLPPSIHPDTGRPYRLAHGDDERDIEAPPRWLIDLVRAPILPPAPPQIRSGSTGDGLIRFVAEAQEGERNAKLYWACCESLRDGTWQATRHPLRQAALSIGLTEHEVDATMRSAERGAA